MLRSLRLRLPWLRGSAKRALVLAGGGVIGGMYEVGVVVALDDALPGFRPTSSTSTSAPARARS